MSLTSILLRTRRDVESAGGVINHRWRKAFRAAKALERILDTPIPPVEGTDYIVTLTNGRQIELFVPKGETVFSMAKDYDVQSFSKKA